MLGLSLQHLDQRTVAVELPIAAEKRVVKGRGRLVAAHPSGNTALHVLVQGIAEEFELIFDVQRFSGVIEQGEGFSCDFAIRLADEFTPGLAMAAT